MYSSVRVKAIIIEDDSGIKSELPIILIESGELTPITDFLLHKEQEGKSRTWMNRVIRATRLLLEYLEVNKNCFSDPRTLFQTFIKRLYTGTIGEDGMDPSGLYWTPISTVATNQLVRALSALMDWLAEKYDIQHVITLVETDSYEQRLQYAAWFRKTHQNFLGHIKNTKANSSIRKARFIKGREQQLLVDDDAIAFSENDFSKFFFNGIGSAKDPRVVLRDKLILLLMHGGGLRISEALSLWIADVFEDPCSPEIALVRIYHPENGKAPNNWRGRNGSTNRAAFLLENYALTPRNRLHGTQWLGWKNRVVDHKDNFIQVQWFPREFGMLFMTLWRDYLRYLAVVERHHPYAFISFHQKHMGSPYTINAFNVNYENGLRRIGLEPNKHMGHDPHGHRHSYGRRLERAGVAPLIIKKCMHHASLDSQLVYTALSLQEVSEKLAEATERLAETENKESSINWAALVEYGFNDIDPNGYFSGKNPKFKGK